jgi:predicted acetyltransferase
MTSRKSSASPSNPAGLVGYVQWVATDAGFRRRGLCGRVMTSLLSWYDDRGVGVVELHATPDGEPVYRRLGFGENGGVALRRRSWDAGTVDPGAPDRGGKGGQR